MSDQAASSPISMQCPHCKKKLKIDNPKLMGKKVKCPGCQKPFVLKAPALPADEEVEMQLVTDEPPVGTSAKWVPDEPALQSPDEQKPLIQTDQERPLFSEPPASADPAPVIAPIANEDNVSEYQRLKTRRKKNWGPTLIVVTFLLLGVGVIGYLVVNYQTTGTSETGTVAQNSDENPQDDPAEVAEDEPYGRSLLSNRPKIVDEFSPIEGEPLDLAMMPSGVSVVIHLRPAELWSKDSLNHQILKASLTDDVTNWLQVKLKELCRREPSQIEEAYLGFILGARGSKPDICAVIHLRESEKMSALNEEFKGKYVFDIQERPELNLKREGDYAYLIKDDKTFAICPATYAAEIAEAMTRPFTLSVQMENLLRKTNRNRLFTLLAVTRDLQLHLPSLLPESGQTAAEQILEWVNPDEVECLCWTIHPDPYLHSELMLHPVSTTPSSKLQSRIASQFEQLPTVLKDDLCLKMQPKELRFRKFIGRLPAMAEAFRQSTINQSNGTFLTMTTVLPAKATPNLVLATLFTVNEAARTDFSVSNVVVAATESNAPKTTLERLQTPVDSEFNARPLEQAFQYLCDEIGVDLHVDGDALKDAGYTKNMPQTFNLGVVPAEQAFAKIINNYQERGKNMVMSVDEKANKITVLTEKFAVQQNLPIYEFKSEE